MEKIIKTEEEWRKQLTPEQYNILRQAGTERPFTGRYWDVRDDGAYVCAGCGQELFTSDEKFDSHCGWPSFSDVKPGAVETREDRSHGMFRTEILCARCDAHLGNTLLANADLSEAFLCEADLTKACLGEGRAERGEPQRGEPHACGP